MFKLLSSLLSYSDKLPESDNDYLVVLKSIDVHSFWEDLNLINSDVLDYHALVF